MQFGPILRAMARNKIGNGLLVAEIAFTLAIVLNCLVIIDGNKTRMNTPSGLDEANLMLVTLRSYGDSFSDDEFLRQTRDQDLQWLRSQENIQDATPISNSPLVGGGSSTQRIRSGADQATAVRCPNYVLDQQGLSTLGLELAEGRDFTRDDISPPPNPGEAPMENRPPIPVIVTQDLADALFPDGRALGQNITSVDGNIVNQIVGIVSYMYTPYDGGKSGMETRILFFPGTPGSAGRQNYMVRAKPGAFDGVFTSVEEGLLGLNHERIIGVSSLTEIRNQSSAFNNFTIKMLSGISGLLVIITALGIFGMTSFSVSARTRQIGTRRALGACKSDIVGQFMLENSMISFFGLSLGLVLAFLLNSLIVSKLSQVTVLGPGLAISGSLALWLLGLFSAALPAQRGASIPPLIATRAP